MLPRKMRRILKHIVLQHFPRFMMAYRYARQHQGFFADAHETLLGFKFLGNALMESGGFEPSETRIAKILLEKVDVFINVGANIGYYCCVALKQGKKVIAFEPLESNLHYLYKNLRANGWEDNIEIYPLALSDRVGLVEISGVGAFASLVKGWAGQIESNSSTVPTSTLDTVLGSRLTGQKCFVLVDIEGSEDRMLQGASSFLLADPKPIWLVEIQTSDHQPKGVPVNPTFLATFNRFWASGYDAWTADTNVRQLHRNEIEDVVRGGPDTVTTRNFLFIEKHKNLDSIYL